MHLIQLLLPLYDNEQHAFAQKEFARVREELTERFGGLTAYVRSPATGLWKEDANRTVHDEIVIYEVMVEQVDRDWWRGYRTELSARFRQEQLVVRASEMEML
jgi:hypothetical protein